MEYSAYSGMMDFAIASAFLLVGQLLRSRVTFFQRYFIPASLIAGMLGLALGPNGFKVVAFSPQVSRYAGLLIILVFVSMGAKGLQFSKGGWKKDVERIGSFYAYEQIQLALQYSLPILLAYYLIRMVYPELHPGFGMMFGSGFIGGHGTAAAVGEAFAQYGWADGTDIGMTFATAGILTGLIGGIILINWAVRNKITSYVSDFAVLPPELRTGLVPADKREEMGKETVSPISIDPLAWHLAVILIPTGLAYVLTEAVADRWAIELPSYAVGFLMAILFHGALTVIKFDDYVDAKVINRIGSCATDYLVFFGVTATKLPIILKYATPLAITLVFGIAMIILSVRYLAPRMNRADWFERAIFIYGYCTGVYATGFILLRIVDPDMKSKTLDDAAITSALSEPVNLVILSLGPILLSAGKIWPFVGPVIAYGIYGLVLALVMKWWYPTLPLARKDLAR